MNTKKVPVFVMLLAGAVTCVVTYLNHYNLHDMLVALILVLLSFLILGIIIKVIFDKFDIAIKDTVDDEGEVVEKQGEMNAEDGSMEAVSDGDETELKAEGEPEEY